MTYPSVIKLTLTIVHFTIHLDLVKTKNALVSGVQTQMDRLDKQLRLLNKRVHDNLYNPTLSIYQNVYGDYPRVVVSHFADELSNSILAFNPYYTRPGLDPQRMAILAGK
ncbi:unnamed protein product [Rotaria sordida]|uniref:Uncharacterized protein n=1 Tax=Rotaria sordida TaxID=392033 RepID=A0A819WJ90_9BILA|nr:unnamed protein product [Rotaria sordida]